MPIVTEISIRSDKKFDDFINDNKIETEETDDHIVHTIPLEKSTRYLKLKKRSESWDVAYHQAPRSILVSLVSAYDSFLSELIKALFYLKPEVLHSSERTLTFSELTGFESIEAAREHVLAKEVESVIRDSHIKQFDWLEKRFDIILRKGLDRWPIFVELTERRNLYVHCDGIVSAQYLELCQKHDVPLGDATIGSRLSIDPAYLKTAYECLFELGLKLAHVLWRKLDKDALSASESELINIGFDLLVDKDYDLTIDILDFFVFKVPKHSSSLNRRINLINLCIAYHHSNNQVKCLDILNNEDWSDCDPKFTLANYVLRNQYGEASTLMRSFGPNYEGISRHSYETWPLFSKFRRSDEFRSTYRELFGDGFEFEEPPVAHTEKVQQNSEAEIEQTDSPKEDN